MKTSRRAALASLALLSAAALTLSACTARNATPADGGESEDAAPIVIGASWPQSGPLGAVAPGLTGLETYIDMTNEAGGIDGHPIELVTADDAYDPARLVENERKFVEKDGAVLVVNFGGISIAGRDYLNQNGVAGISMAGNSPLSDIEGFPLQRAFWSDVSWEGHLQANWLKAEKPDAAVGYIGFNNDLSESQLAGLKAGGVEPVETALVAPGTADLSAQISQFQAAAVDTVIINIGAPTVGAVLAYIHQIGWEPTIILGSTTSDFTTAIHQAGGDAVEGAYAFKTFIDPADPRFAEDPDYLAYAAAVTEAGHEDVLGDAMTIQGYGLGAAIVAALEGADSYDSEGIIAAWDSFSELENPLLVPGIVYDSGPHGRIAFQFEFSRFDGTSWLPEGEIVDVRDEGIVE
ncbi:ABC transporter substrate-binding protein [Microbacterium invictum]|uniref:ABC-type branched-subunit amino acid transport system substrate-binding protein n=1 Tax=Microbacterium invictum TaxID=515415 RepID=A0AA40SRK6_9MICO|nr:MULTISPECIES: ABC transporter substrate-binding protein [Microbacterium]MBB4141009.1 ABC-type branched-subunit amino acid transport system substrate-binding protein [Microbacterium invictum]